MQAEGFEIVPYADSLRPQILAIWEASVLATHTFLAPADFEEIKLMVAGIDFSDLQVFCLANDHQVVGFVGVADQKVEMLFLDPAYFGRGLGQKLLRYAVNELRATEVDVNEQNTKALEFYRKFGFEAFARTDADDQGRAYPLLRMRLYG